eukprot:6538077-Alexandrium_andersonii.AAC.1
MRSTPCTRAPTPPGLPLHAEAPPDQDGPPAEGPPQTARAFACRRAWPQLTHNPKARRPLGGGCE